MELYVGKIVEANEDFPSGNDVIKKGFRGVVLKDCGTWINVQWEENVQGHTCDGECLLGHGWNVDKDEVIIVDITREIREITKNEILELI